jgi:hypothetical protein
LVGAIQNPPIIEEQDWWRKDWIIKITWEFLSFGLSSL